MTSQTSYYPVTTTTMRHCSILEFGREHAIKQSPRSSPDQRWADCEIFQSESSPDPMKLNPIQSWSPNFLKIISPIQSWSA